MTRVDERVVTFGRLRELRVPLLEFVLLIALLTAYETVPYGNNSVVIWACLLLQYALIIGAVRKPLVIYGGIPTYMTAEFLFLFFSYFIFFYPYQLHELGIYDISRSAFFGNTFVEHANHAILLSSMGMVAFRAGIRALGSSAIKKAACRDSRRTQFDEVEVRSLAPVVFILLTILTAIYSSFGWRAAGEGRYSGQVTGGPLVEGVYLAIVVLSMVAVALWILPQSQAGRRPILVTLSLALASFWATRLLLSGDRNSFMLIAIVALGGVLTFRVRAGRMLLAALCAVAIALYNGIEAARSGKSSLVDFFLSGGRVLVDAYGGDSSFNISTISVRAALAAVPEYIDYGYGFYKLIGLGGLVPFIRGLIVPPDTSYTQSSDVLSQILLGDWAHWGVGTNIIVDIYVDFGAYAVPVVLFLLGLFVASVQRNLMLYPDSPWRIVFYLMTLALIAEIPRYTLDFPLRPLVWVVLLFWTVSLVSKTRLSRSTAQAEWT